MVRQLVNNANVPQNNIIVYDVRRSIFPAMLTTIWKEFKDVRFVQEKPASDAQPVNPAYGDHHGLEAADWVEAISYSAGNYKDAKLIPRQIKDATYLINLALLKLHSYPYNYMEDGDEGQTALTMCGKNHAGSIKGTPELHSILNTKRKERKMPILPWLIWLHRPTWAPKLFFLFWMAYIAGANGAATLCISPILLLITK